MFFDPLLLLVLALIVVWSVVTAVVVTPQQHVKMIETFGRYSRSARAGLTLKWPNPIQSASAPFSLQIQQVQTVVGVKSVDNAFVEVPINVQYSVKSGSAQDAFYKLSEPQAQIKSYVINQVRGTASGMAFADLFQSKAVFDDDVQSTLMAKFSDYGYEIVNVLVDDPQPSAELRAAFDRVLASQRLAEAAENEGEAERILKVKRAEAEKEAMELKAQGYANFRKIVAEGNAAALHEFTKDTDLSPDKVLDFFTDINQMEALRDAASAGGQTVLVTGGRDPLSALLANRKDSNG